MIPEDWARVRSILEPALELDAQHRSRFLDDVCSDPALRQDVESLIKLHDEAGTDFLSSPSVPEFFAGEETQFRLRRGTRIGAYEVLDEIAQGGMGTVYRAVRADGQYTQEVALKIVRAGIGAELVAARFRNERQILASLDHPNIGKLLDGGTTSDGLPYFVMELIDGLPITQYCDEKQLSIDARLQLFHTVCAAVHHAHQRLMIHRDIKPANILITREGIPKLLDFGIAKALDPELLPQNLATTVSGFWMMTPEYASPEQVRGESVTTATDVYSLGLVLYELLTGRRAYRIASPMPHEIAQAACNVEPEKPSLAILKNDAASGDSAKPLDSEEQCRVRGTSEAKLRKRLQGDLDNIVLMALRKEPSRRYSSAEQFGEDVRRHLESIPVVARHDSPWYRTSKFVRRHKAGVAASIAMGIALLGGFAITMHEARVARLQAEVARLQRARAERRFNDVRKLANSLMFEVHDSIRDLPGATPARKLLVERALEYLDSLSQEATGDQGLQRELAAAYDRVGDLLGYNGAANLGDYRGALQSYNKALAIREASAAANPDDQQINTELLNDYFHLSFAQQDIGDYTGALNNLQKALPVAQRLAAANSDPKYKDWLAGISWKRAGVLEVAGDNPQALENFRQAIAIRAPIAANLNADPLFRTHLAADYVGLGKALGRAGDSAHGLENLRSGAQILQQLSQSSPTNSTLREYLANTYNEISLLLEKQREYGQALYESRRSRQIFEELYSSDPTDALARDNLALMEFNTGRLLSLQGHAKESLPDLRRAVSRLDAIQHKNRYEITGQIEARLTLGRAYVAIADRENSPAKKTENLLEARSLFQKTLETLRQNPGLDFSQDTVNPSEDGIVQELAKCDAALAKIAARKLQRPVAP